MTTLDPARQTASTRAATRPASVRRNLARGVALLATALAVAACNVESLLDGPAATCVESGVQCQLDAGPLGVCERTQCGAGETSPCFQCTPQH